MGEVHLTIGPMFSGKTTKLMDNYYYMCKYYKNKKCMIINYKDVEFSNGYMENHTLNKLCCFNCNELKEAMKYIEEQKIDYVFINEYQFYDDILDFILKYEKKLAIYLYGIDCDFKRNPIKHSLNVIPYCNSVVKLNGKCSKCNLDSIFSYRQTKETTQIVLDPDSYIPLCRNCYLL